MASSVPAPQLERVPLAGIQRGEHGWRNIPDVVREAIVQVRL
jgi:hypothetical protein